MTAEAQRRLIKCLAVLDFFEKPLMVAPSLSRATVFSTAGGNCSLVIFRSCAFVTESEIKQAMAASANLSLEVMDRSFL